ncbi:hypothetical protein L1F30_05270 [Simiduia sp. 21SJ11W-1]|uniref:hypothetical protein n=1 Tax=Simiduia sp. 21SJ11W-1 TaxID=2909669 RepID=UPI00209C75C4|nr:hypothetical protein [Simiduia sp. 21SJ11W-1]UTA48957.1 hypothetical protein L1F30_05270 [Simiduia sp. 21SJ11W-1]
MIAGSFFYYYSKAITLRIFFGWLALCFPLVIWFFNAFTSITARWHFAEHHRFFDLLADVGSLVVFSLGLVLLLKREDVLKAIALVAVIFTGIQFWIWQSTPERSLATLELPSGVVAAIAVNREDFTVEGAVDLILYRPYWGVFIEPVATLARVDYVFECRLTQPRPGVVLLELELLDHQQKQLLVSIPDL